MSERSVSSGTEWEERVGYARAVRVGDRVLVAGPTATDEEGAVAPAGEPHPQAARTIQKVGPALSEAGAALEDVVRTRLDVVDADDWEAVGRAHAEAFGDGRPATTLVEVSRLVDPRLVVESEAAVVAYPTVRTGRAPVGSF